MCRQETAHVYVGFLIAHINTSLCAACVDRALACCFCDDCTTCATVYARSGNNTIVGCGNMRMPASLFGAQCRSRGSILEPNMSR